MSGVEFRISSVDECSLVIIEFRKESIIKIPMTNRY